MRYFSCLPLLVSAASAFPWVANQPGVDSSLLKNSPQQRREVSCPFNSNHEGAAPYSAKYPYTGAKNGLPGTGIGGIKVPADGDTAHTYVAPGVNNIRGPCPGLNAAANHNFLSHDGITNFNELVDAQQNVYNVGYDLAVLLAVLGIQADGDIVTQKLSIGCDATSRTAALPLISKQGGLNTHNKFESDTSLTRNDYFPANGDDYTFNGTLFAEMKDVADRVSGGKFDRAAMAAYRSQRYDESKRENANFFFGPLTALLYGAASFLYELFPSYGNEGTPDLATISSFFGTQEDASAPGGWSHFGEKIPDNWFNRRAPYTIPDVAIEILAQYVAYPKLFGGNLGKDNFDGLSTPFGIIADGKLPDNTTAAAVACLLYQLGTENVPSSLDIVNILPVDVLTWTLGKLNPIFKNFGCPIRTN